MKKVIPSILSVMLILLAFSSQSFSSNPITKNAKITWVATVFDFGTITKGEPVSHEFEFTNSGDAPLIIMDVKATCGCTVPVYPKEPIAPGESEIIKVTYNAAKPGAFHKKVNVFTNTEEKAFVLNIKGEVAQ